MSKYNEYAQKLDQAFQEADKAQRVAHATLIDAADAVKKGPNLRYGEQYPGQQKAMEAKLLAEYEDAEAAMKETQKRAWDHFHEVKRDLTWQLEQEIEKDQLAHPDDLDQDAIMLLNSGVLGRKDMEAMAQQFADNSTMLRLISKAAREMAENESNSEERHALSALAEWCHNTHTGARKAWDELITVADHYSGKNNRRNKEAVLVENLAQHWNDPNVREAIKNF